MLWLPAKDEVSILYKGAAYVVMMDSNRLSLLWANTLIFAEYLHRLTICAYFSFEPSDEEKNLIILN